jgi:hypothetical protein
MTVYENGLTWEQIHFELDGIDDYVESHNKEHDEYFECSKHEIKHRGVPGACPLCLLRTFFEEKERIGDQE